MSVQPSQELTPENAASLSRGPSKAAILYDQPWLTSFVRPLLIVLLVSCIDLILVTIMLRFAASVGAVTESAMIRAGWLALSIGAALVACISSTVLAQPAQRLQRTFGYRMSELGILLLVGRIVLWLLQGGVPDGATLLTHPLNVIFDGVFIATIVLITLSWSLTSEITTDLQQLALQADELFTAQHHYDRLGEMARTSGVDRTQVLNGFVWRWVSVGLFLIFCAALLRQELAQRLSFAGVFSLVRQDLEPTVIGALLSYFVCGLLLIGLSQLALLRSRWLLEKTPTRSNILLNWPSYVGMLVGGVAMVAALLPLGETFLLAQILSTIISAVFLAATTLMQLLMTLLGLLLGGLFGDAPLQSTPAATPVVMPTPTPMPAPGQTLPEWTGGALFWLVMGFLLVNAALIYFSGRTPGFAWLTWLWNTIRLRLAQFLQSIRSSRRLQFGNKASLGESTSAANLAEELAAIDVSKLNPSELARYYYLSTLSAAEEAGTERARSETPLHYEPRLLDAIAQKMTQTTPDPTVAEEIQQLTHAFLDVRYAGKMAETSTISHLRQIWERMKKRLRNNF